MRLITLIMHRYGRLMTQTKRVAILGLCVILTASPSMAEESTAGVLTLDSQQKIELKELAFGELLFDYYQENYFAALTRLDVAEYKGEVIEHKNHLKILRGVMYLSYGMLKSAEDIFTELLSQETADQRLAQVRFYLGKTNYLNGNYQEALAHFERAAQHLPPELVDEALLIRSQIAFIQGQTEQAQNLLEQISAESKQGKYARFNLAIFLLQRNQVDDAKELFDSLYPSKASTDIEKSLFDRANLAMGYYYLENNETETAREYLLNVRLNSMTSHRAILSLGWAYYQAGLQSKAVAHWTTLLDRDPRDPAVQEAAMAVAFAYYKNGAKKEALEAFVLAAAMYGEQLTIIESARADLQYDLFARWLDAQGLFGNKIFDRWSVGDVPITGQPIEYYLQEVAATNEFNQYFHRYQEMSHLDQVLSRWERQLPVFEEMLSNHRLRYETIKPQVQQRTNAMLDQNVKQQYQSMVTIAEQRLAANDPMIIADADELELLQDLKRLKLTMDSIPPDQFDLEDQYEQWRRAYGAVLWNIASQYGPKRYRLEKQMKEAKQAIEALEVQKVSIASAEQKASSRFLNYDQRIFGLKTKITSLKAAIEQTKEASRQAMEKVLIARLDKRKQELDFLLAQTELSIAKIQDEAVSRLLDSGNQESNQNDAATDEGLEESIDGNLDENRDEDTDVDVNKPSKTPSESDKPTTTASATREARNG